MTRKGKRTKTWTDLSKEEVALLDPLSLQSQDPARFDCVKKLLLEGVSLRAIARATGTGQHTIEKIMASDPSLKLGVQALAAKSVRLAHHAGDRLLERLEDDAQAAEFSAQALGVAFGIATDKSEKLLSSQVPQQQVNVQINVNEAADLNALAQGLPSVNKDSSQPIDVEEVATKTG